MKRKHDPKNLQGSRPFAPVNLLGEVEMVRLIALAAWITQTHQALSRSLIRLERRYGGLAQWFRVERSTAGGAKVRLLVKPTKAARDLIAAGLALCHEKRGVKTTTREKHLLKILQSDKWIAHGMKSPNEKAH